MHTTLPPGRGWRQLPSDQRAAWERRAASARYKWERYCHTARLAAQLSATLTKALSIRSASQSDGSGADAEALRLHD